MYIHQRQDWPHFHWNQETITRQLASVRHQQGRLLGRLGKCSQDTANRDINDLLTRCILKKDPGGGRSTSYSINHPSKTGGDHQA